MKLQISHKKSTIAEAFGLSKEREEKLDKALHETCCPVHGKEFETKTERLEAVLKAFGPKNDNEWAYAIYLTAQKMQKRENRAEEAIDMLAGILGAKVEKHTIEIKIDKNGKAKVTNH